jgi:8-oxo-dGTP pyrophosphatase MutT (NUDIX family)
MILANLNEKYISTKLFKATKANSRDNGLSEQNTESSSDERCAAVLIPLAWFGDEWHLVYTRRTDNVETHKGQVAFPGGACDPGETTPEQTALREAEEEIGLSPNDVRVLGHLNPMITITSFRVSPVVGVIPWPYTFQVETGEVARVFTIPLSYLMEKKNRWEFKLPGRRYGLIVYHPYDGELLWGATAIMTDSFLKILDLIK